MKLKIDENLPLEVAELLQAADLDAVSVLEQGLGGHPDQSIADVCKKENRGIITLDTDFANIRAYPPQEFSGIIVFRVKNQSKSAILKLVPRLLKALRANPSEGQLWIVEEERIRIRGWE